MLPTILIILVVGSTALQSLSTKLAAKTGQSVSSFNAQKALSALALFAALALGGFVWHGQTVLFGGLYGLLLSLSMQSGYYALRYGPVSLSSLLASFSLVIPLLYGFFFLWETFTAVQGIGLALLALCLILSRKKGPEKKAVSFRWAVYITLTVIANGFCAIIQMAHQNLFQGLYHAEFMVFAMMVSSAIFLSAGCVKKIGGIMTVPLPVPTSKGSAAGQVIPPQTLETRPLGARLKQGFLYGVAAGALNGTANYLTLVLIGQVKASVLFPILSACTILTTFVLGAAFFRERYSRWQLMGVMMAVASVVLLRL
ncbi:MAG: hypothetical protein WDA00_02945 [Eubacteriales bacterium]